jgi:transposase
VLKTLSSYRESIVGIAVESTYNWYWPVDGLQKAGYKVHLVNTSAVIQYEGLKYTDDKSDARWLAHLLRLKILPEGYIYPKEERAIRDLLRRRQSLVRQHTSNLLSVQNIVVRNTAVKINANAIKKLEITELEKIISNQNILQAVACNLSVMSCLQEQTRKIELSVKNQMKLKPEFRKLLTVNGIGDILALTIMLETGDIGRFPTVGDYSSYCRCVGSSKITNGKKKGKGNTKNGNEYLAWAYVEAANFAVRFNTRARRFYQRKCSNTREVIAKKAVAHKLARACFYIMRDQVDFDDTKAFA